MPQNVSKTGYINLNCLCPKTNLNRGFEGAMEIVFYLKLSIFESFFFNFIQGILRHLRMILSISEKIVQFMQDIVTFHLHFFYTKVTVQTYFFT